MENKSVKDVKIYIKNTDQKKAGVTTLISKSIIQNKENYQRKGVKSYGDQGVNFPKEYKILNVCVLIKSRKKCLK